MLLIRNQKDEAIKTAQYGISLNPQYYEGYCRLAQFYYVLNDDKNMGAQLSKCINLGGLDTITSDSLLKKAITYYISQKDYATALKLSEKQAASSSDGNDWLNLAKLYLINNDLTSALAAGQQAIRLDPSLTTAWNSILNTLKGLGSSTSSKVKK